MMPVMDGSEVFRRIREIPALACVPVLVISSAAQPARFTTDEFLETLARCCAA